MYVKITLIVMLLSLAISGFSQQIQSIKRLYVSLGLTESFRIATVPMKVSTADGTVLDAKRLPFLNLKNAPPILGGGHLGFDAVCLFPMSRFGFDVMVNYHRFGISMTYPGNDWKTNYVTNSVVPEFDLRIELGDKIAHSEAPIAVAYLGAAYNYHFSYSGIFDNGPNMRNAVNNGLEGVIGVGLQYIPAIIMQMLNTAMESDQLIEYNNDHHSHNLDDMRNSFKKHKPYFSIALMYRHNFYDYFNQGYHYNANDSYPFEGFSSKFGEIFIRFTVGE
jgi:hypothetical protein